VVFAAVVALHAGLVITLTLALRTQARRSTADDFVSALIFLSTPVPPTSSSRRPARASTAAAPAEQAAAPLPGISEPADAGTSIDWDTEARRASTAVTGAQKFREFGQIPKADVARDLRAPPAHVAGEQYRDEDGTWIVWVSPHCFSVSELPPLGMPDILARSLPTRTGCEGSPEPRGDLFKDLPAYQKYHPQ
jgi:hypothetical protein